MNKVYIVETYDICDNYGSIIAIAGSYELAKRIAKAYVEVQMKCFDIDGPITEKEENGNYYISFNNDREHVRSSKMSIYMTDNQVDEYIKANREFIEPIREEEENDN